MKFIETLKLALAAIWVHKLRSALTLLGMIIGVMAFVVVVSLISGFNVYVDEKIAGIGTKSFNIQRFNPFEDFKDTDTIAAAQRRNKELTLDDYEYLLERATLTGKLGAKARGTPSEVKREGQLLEDVFVAGATANTADIENRDIADGRFFTKSEDDSASRVAYVGADVASKLFPAGNGIGNEISIRGLLYRVIGIETAKGTVFGIRRTLHCDSAATHAITYGLMRQRFSISWDCERTTCSTMQLRSHARCCALAANRPAKRTTGTHPDAITACAIVSSVRSSGRNVCSRHCDDCRQSSS